MSSHRSMFYVFLIGASLVLIFIVVLVKYLTAANPTNRFTVYIPTHGEEQETNISDQSFSRKTELATYTDKQHGFSFQYPKNWTIDNSNPFSLFLHDRTVTFSLTITPYSCLDDTPGRQSEIYLCDNFFTNEHLPANITAGKRVDQIARYGDSHDISYGYIKGTVYNIGNSRIDQLQIINTFDAKQLGEMASVAPTAAQENPPLPTIITDQVALFRTALSNVQTKGLADFSLDGYREYTSANYGLRLWYPNSWGDIRNENTTFYYTANNGNDRDMPDYFSVTPDPDTIDYCQSRLPGNKTVLRCEKLATRDSFPGYIRVSHNMIGKDLVEAEIPKIKSDLFRKVRLETSIDELQYASDKEREIEREIRASCLRDIVETFQLQ